MIFSTVDFHLSHRLLTDDSVTWDLRTRGPGVSPSGCVPNFSFWMSLEKPRAGFVSVPGVKFNKSVIIVDEVLAKAFGSQRISLPAG